MVNKFHAKCPCISQEQERFTITSQSPRKCS